MARCTVERLMRSMGLQGVVRGRISDTTNPDTARALSRRQGEPAVQGRAAEPLWVSDFTYVPTWSGTVYVAFVIDVFARGSSVGASPPRCRRGSCSTPSTRRSGEDSPPVSNEPGPSLGPRARNTLSINTPSASPRRASTRRSGPSATAMTTRSPRRSSASTRPRSSATGPWRSIEPSSRQPRWIDRYNNRRLLEPIGYIPPAEAEARYYAQLENEPIAAGSNRNSLRETRGGSVYLTDAQCSSLSWRHHRITMRTSMPS